jgi:hypothetical protein
MTDWQIALVVMVVAFALLVRVLQPKPARRWHKRVEPEYQTVQYDDASTHDSSPRQFYFDERTRDWEHIPGTGEPEPGPLSLIDQRIRDGVNTETHSHRVTGRDLAEVMGRAEEVRR